MAPSIPALQLATRSAANVFEYQGPLAGEAVNEAGVLSGTPTIDEAGDLYFISDRSYAQTLSTVYGGAFSAGAVSGVHLVQGVSAPSPGLVDFDVSVSPDGTRLYMSVGDFSGGSGPTSARIAVFDRVSGGFAADPDSARLMHAVDNPHRLDYAPCVSADGLELFFTRADTAKPRATPEIYRATRASTSKPFGHVEHVAAISGFAEAPALSGDGRTLYYHLLVGDRFEIESVTRP